MNFHVRGGIRLGSALLALALAEQLGLASATNLNVKGDRPQRSVLTKLTQVEDLDLSYDPLLDEDLKALIGNKEAPRVPAYRAPSQPAASYTPAGPVKTAAVDNKGAVKNGPSNPVEINTPGPIFVKSIRTYHWNGGRGSRPGTISIRASGGRTLGPWQARGVNGSGGVPNAYWYVEPDVVLMPGKYQIIDSNPSTWATNAAAGSKGFVVIKYQAVETISKSGGEDKPQGQAATAVGTKRYVNPMLGEFRLDWCLKNQKNCGKPAADEFCKFWSLAEAVSFRKADGVGKREPTREILDGAICEKPSCNGFSEIICR